MAITKRFPFTVSRSGDEVFVSMDIGGVVRARNMPLDFLPVLAKACKEARARVIDVVNGDPAALARIPASPGYARLADADLGPVEVVIGGCTEDGGPEFSVAFYDHDDKECPALLLINEQIEEFVDRANQILAPLNN